MPTYQYRCQDCGRDLEIFQKFSDPSLTVCPQCQGALRKVFNAVGVVFKGSGFYKTDSRNGSSAGAKTGSTPSESSSENGKTKSVEPSKSNSSDSGSSGSAASSSGTASKPTT